MMTVLVLVRASLIDELYFMNGSFMFLSESGVSCVKAISGALQRQKIWSVQPDLLRGDVFFWCCAHLIVSHPRRCWKHVW